MWHLLISSLRYRKTYSLLIIFAVAFAVVAVLSAYFLSFSMQGQLEEKQMQLGPELAIVPPGTKEGGQIYLTKGPPAGELPEDLTALALAFPEIIAASPQRVGSNLDGSQPMIIEFDPTTDFMIKPWLKKPDAIGDREAVFAGSNIGPDQLKTAFPDNPEPRSHALKPTGTFMDDAIFVPKAGVTANPTWIMLGVQPGVSIDMLINKLQTNLPGIEIIGRPELLKTIGDQLHGVSEGGMLDVTALLIAIAIFLVLFALFALFAYEQRREFGLFKAMGASNGFIFSLVLSQATVLGSIGAILGLIFFIIWLLIFNAMPASGGMAFSSQIFIALPGIILLTLFLCLLASIIPALMASRREPYAMIRQSE